MTPGIMPGQHYERAPFPFAAHGQPLMASCSCSIFSSMSLKAGGRSSNIIGIIAR